MDTLLHNYLHDKKTKRIEASLSERNKVLIEEGLYTKEYSNTYSNEYKYIEDGKYYKKVAIEVTDEEFQEILKYRVEPNETSNHNGVATALKVVAILIYIIGFIIGIVMGNVEVEGYYSTRTEYHLEISLIYWAVSFISGLMFLSIAEIIKLLTEIKNKQK